MQKCHWTTPLPPFLSFSLLSHLPPGWQPTEGGGGGRVARLRSSACRQQVATAVARRVCGGGPAGGARGHRRRASGAASAATPTVAGGKRSGVDGACAATRKVAGNACGAAAARMRSSFGGARVDRRQRTCGAVSAAHGRTASSAGAERRWRCAAWSARTCDNNANKVFDEMALKDVMVWSWKILLNTFYTHLNFYWSQLSLELEFRVGSWSSELYKRGLNLYFSYESLYSCRLLFFLLLANFFVVLLISLCRFYTTLSYRSFRSFMDEFSSSPYYSSPLCLLLLTKDNLLLSWSWLYLCASFCTSLALFSFDGLLKIHASTTFCRVGCISFIFCIF